MRSAIVLLLVSLPVISFAEEPAAPRFGIGVRGFRAAAGEFEATRDSDQIHGGPNSGGRLFVEYAFHERWSLALNGGFAIAGNGDGVRVFDFAVEPTIRFRLTPYLSTGPWIGLAVPFWRSAGSVSGFDESHVQVGGDLLAGFTYRVPAGLTFEFAFGAGTFARWDRVAFFALPGESERFRSGGGLRATASIGWSF